MIHIFNAIAIKKARKQILMRIQKKESSYCASWNVN
jgi:hypothetical protein